MLAPTIKNPSDLLNKLIREARRSFHAGHPTHVADHLYNFCVTSNALRDCVFEARGLTDERARQPFYDGWNQEPARVACSEIANTMKHTTLRTREGQPKRVRTKRADLGKMGVADILVDDVGRLVPVFRERPTVIVHLPDDTNIEAWQLTSAVIDFWRGYFTADGLPHTDQSDDELFGATADDGGAPLRAIRPFFGWPETDQRSEEASED